MWYMGGKFRQSKVIKSVVCDAYKHGAYAEPFVGAMGAAEKVVPALAEKGCREFFLSDKSQPIIDLWSRALFDGWTPPDWTSEDEYANYANNRHGYVEDPMFAWCGYGLSFGGKWYGGFARGGAKGQTSERMQLNQKKAFMRKVGALRPYLDHIKLTCCSYTETLPLVGLVYCDPPYAGRTKAHHTADGFNHDEFWDWCRGRSKFAKVFVTEFNVPDDSRVVHNWGDTVVRHNNGSGSDGTNEVLVEITHG